MANIFKLVPDGCLIRWTPAAFQCYKSRFNCANCSIIKGLETITPENCNMKAVVNNLIIKYGIPNSNDIRGGKP